MIDNIYKNALDQSAIVAITDEKGVIIHVNDKFCEISGYSEQELLGQDHRILNSGYHPKGFFKNMWATIGKGQQWKAEIKNKNKQGKFYWVYTTIVPLINAQGKPYQYISIRFDITEKKQLEERLKLKNEILNKTNKIARIGSWTYNAKEQTFDWSTITKELFNVSHDFKPTLQNTLHFFAKDSQHENFTKALEAAVNKHKQFDIETHLYNENYQVCVRIIGYPVIDNGQCKFINGVMQDISEHKKQLQLQTENLNLQKSKEIAEQTAKEKELFLANMSHEIRTPLNAVVGLSNLLAKSDNLNTKQNEYLKAILGNAKNLLGIINNILDYSKMEAGKIQLEHIAFNLKENLKEVVRSLSGLANDKGIDIVFDVPENIPQKVVGDSVSITQIVSNLISNAIKFTKKGSITLTLGVEEETDESINIKFSVKDTGIGIPENKQASVFEMFTQATSSTTRKYGGTGLGLSIVKKLIEAHKSQIHLKSKLNEGSEFYFTIPFGKVSSTKDDEPLHRQLKPIENINILLVEDNEFNQMVAIDTLLDWSPSIKIDVAENGLIALQKVETGNYDLILMDIQMPIMDGHAASTHIRTKFSSPIKDTPIIAMTARASAANELELCKQSGMNDYISKPFEPEKLFFTISKVFSGAKVKVDRTLPTIVNLDTIDDFTKGSKERQKKMIGMFLFDIPITLKKTQEAYNEKNYRALKMLIHSVKPSYTYLGMPQLAKIAKQIEFNADTETNIEQTKLLIDELVKQTEIAIEELKNFIGN